MDKKIISHYTTSRIPMFLYLAFWVAFLYASMVVFVAPAPILFGSIMILIAIYTLTTWGDLTIREDGILLKTLLGSRFIARSRITHVQNTGFQIHVFVKDWVFLPRIIVMPWQREFTKIHKTLKQYIAD